MGRLERFSKWVGENVYLILAVIFILLLVFYAIYLVAGPTVDSTVLGVVIGLAFSSLTAMVNHFLGLQKERTDWEREMKLEERKQKEQQRQELRAAYEEAISSLGNVILHGITNNEYFARMQDALARLSLYLPTEQAELSGYPTGFSEEVSRFNEAYDLLLGRNFPYRDMAIIVRDLSLNDPRLIASENDSK